MRFSLKQIFLVVFSFLLPDLHAQAGNAVYAFLDLPVSSRVAALGGSHVSLQAHDISFAFNNPALLTTDNHKQINLSMSNYIADVQFGSAMYGLVSNGKNQFALGIQYIDYGTFDQRDEVDTQLGNFSATDLALNLVYARVLNNQFSVGATFKPIFSNFERYTSYGFAIDAGVNYVNAKNDLWVGLVLRNAGMQIKGYYQNQDGQHREPLPLNLLLGVTKKLAHAPFRFSLTIHNLQQWNLNVQTNATLNNAADEMGISFVDMAFRHAIFGIEFVPGKNFYLAASYNHRRHAELQMNGFKSMAGFSFGGGLKLSKFHVGFASSNFQRGITAYQFSVSTSLSEFNL